MATSGSTSWSLNRDQAIKAAYRKLGVLPSGATPTTNQINDAVDALNGLVKTLQADGMPLWKITSQSFQTVSGTSSYTVGPSQTINCPKPLKVLQALYTPSGGINMPMNVYNRYDFNELPQGSTVTGTPINFYYQPLRLTGTVNVWPTPNDSTSTITFHYQSMYEDMTNGTDDFDFPSEWIMPITYLLAWVLAPEYGIPPNDRKLLQQEAEFWHQYVLSMGGEEGSIFFQPDTE